MNGRHRSDDQQHQRNLTNIVVLSEAREPIGRLQAKARSGAAAAKRGAEGDALRKGRR